MSNAIEFSLDNKSAAITIEQLAQTMELGDSKGVLPPSIPVHPARLLQSIVDTARRLTNIEIVQQPIIIREQYCQTNRKKIQEGKELELGDYIIRRFATKIEFNMPAFEGTEDEIRPGVAITYLNTDSAKGIQVAFGENVYACQNLMAFGKYKVSTFGATKISFEEVMQMLEFWLSNLDNLHFRHVDIIEQLRNHIVSKEEYISIIGELFRMAVLTNNNVKTMAPMNQSQVAAMVANCKDMYAGDEPVTGWQVLNAGTQVLKPQTSDIIQLLDSTTGFNDFILRKFGISMDEEPQLSEVEEDFEE